MSVAIIQGETVVLDWPREEGENPYLEVVGTKLTNVIK